MFVYQCVEGHAVPPARGEIVNVDVWIPNKDKAQEKRQQSYQIKIYSFAKCSVQEKACKYYKNVRQ